MGGPETHEEIRRSLQQAATALRLPFADWLNGMTEELLLYKRILVEKETWGASPLSSSQGSSGSRESSSKVWSEHIELLMARLEDSFEFLKQSFIPCSWAWVTLASTVDRIVEDVVAETATLPAQSSNLPSVTRRINTLAFLDDRYPALIDSIVAAFTARHEFIRDGSVGELLEVFAETRSSIFPRAQQLIPTASSLAFTASSSVLNALYSIDMNHYKKYKHKDAFTQTNKHLKQATDHTMKTYLSQLETAFACSNTRLTPLGGIPSKVFLAVLKNFVEVLQAVLLGESANRWYYAEQSAAFESDIQAAKRFFTSKGIGPETVSTVFAKLSALVSTVMSQPTEQLINGGGICLPFNDLPEEAKGSVWCKQVVRQVLARRKDKKAKAFVAKQAKHSHKR
ncbi:hypothetical protein DIPPA_15379 [Diplonema papillatum]|nr:hypothetical protein DIPPA_15379 [Diplonema papillatum]